MTTAECIQIWTLVITGSGVLFALEGVIWQTVLTRQQIKLSFFADYTRRYQEIILHFPENINCKDFSFDKLKVEDIETYNTTLRYMRAYFDLSSEEHYLASIGKIDSKIWNEWSDGIKFTFSKTAFRQAWKIVNLDSKFYHNFIKYVELEVLNVS